MGKVKDVKFVFNSSQPFKPGNVVSGQAFFTLVQQIKVQYILLSFDGRCKVKWTKGSGDDEKSYKGEEVYLHHESCVYGQVGGSEEVSLSAGQYKPSFQFTLPTALPSSFSSKYGNIVYTASLSAVFSGVFTSNEYFGQVMAIVNPVITPTDNTPARISAEGAYTGCCGMSSESLKIEVTADKSSYHPGDVITINGYVTNRSNTATDKVKLILVQHLKVYGKRTDSFFGGNNIKSKEKLFNVVEWIGENVERNGTYNITNRRSIIVPRIPESNLPHCQIIDVSYYLRFQAQLPGLCQLSLDSPPVPIFIGNTRSEGSETIVLPSAPVDDSQVTITMPEMTGGGDAAPSYTDLSPPVAKEPPPPSYTAATQFGSVFSSTTNEERSALNPPPANTDNQPAQGSYYDWSQSVFTYN